MQYENKPSNLPNPKWLAITAIALAVWAVALGVWWSHLHVAPTAVRPITSPEPTLITAATPRPGETAAPTPAAEATPTIAPVIRSPDNWVRQEDWLALTKSFDEKRALADIAELASPKYAGRAVGSPGGQLAAEWIAARFAEYGLQPAGDNGTYFQEFPVPYAELTAMPSFQLVDEAGKVQQEYHFRRDYSIWLGGYTDGGTAEGPVLWVSDGKHDDYDRLNAEGAIVLCRFRLPLDETLRQAIEHGAKAVLLIREEYNHRMRRTAREDALLPQGIPTLLVSPQVAQDLLSGSGMTLDDLTIEYEPRPLATHVRLDVPLQYQEGAVGRNVLGVLPGSDPDGVNQVVILSGHYDHLGADPDGTNWGGANDNASGVAVLLEVARQWQAHGYVPKRTVLFATWDGEEIGLFGSKYYVEHPRFPLTMTVGMLNLDMVGAGTPELFIDAGGLVADQSVISAAQLGIPVRTQSMGRSDHASFVGANVPATLYIWWDGQVPVIYHVPEDTVDNIEPAKLKAAGQLADLVMLNLSWEQEELEDLAAERGQAIASRDVAALLRGVDVQADSLRQQEEAWLTALSARQPAEFSVAADAALITGNVATSTLTVRYHWRAGDSQVAASFPTKWIRRGLDWYYAGPDWNEVKDEHVRIEHLQQPDQAEMLTQQADALYGRLKDEMGLDMPGTLTVRLYSSDSLAHALEIPPSLVGQVDNLPYYTDKASGWPVNGGIVLSRPTVITTTLLEFALQRAGWPITASQWLAQGLSDHWRSDDPATAQEIEAEYVPLLLQADTDKALWPATAMPGRYEVPVEKDKLWAAQAWAMTRYLLQTGGWPALQQPSLTQIEPWRTALLEPWRAAMQGINATLAERSKAVLARDQAAFLATVDAANATLYQEEQHWFADLQIHPAKTFVLEGQLLSLSGNQATVRLHMEYRLAEADSMLGTVTWRARFVQRDGRWLYGDVDFDEAQSAHFVLKFINAEQGAHAQELLAAAERAYAQVSGDLNFHPLQPIEIKLYDQADLFRTSIFLSMPSAHGWTEPGESIKLANPDLANTGRIIAHELTHQALFAMGVQHNGVHEGISQYEAGRFDPQWQAQQVRKWRQQVYDVVRSGRAISLATLTNWRELPGDELSLIYNLSWDVVTYFQKRYGQATFRKWLDLLGSSASFESAFLQATGTTFADFDAAWRESVLRGHIARQDIATAQAFSGEQALQHVQALAQPAWAGREAGTAGNQAAAQYIADRFAEYGLQPAGDNGTYFQVLPISQTALITIPVLALQSEDGQRLTNLRYRVDFRELIRGRAGGGRIENSIVYIKSSALDSQRLSGRVLLTEGTGTVRDVQAAWEHGAGALLLVTDKISKEMALKSDYLPSLETDTIPTYLLTKEAFESLLKLGGRNTAQLANAPVALPLPLRARVEVQLAITPTVQVANVLGVLPGSDPQLAHQVLIVGAHLDHIGSLPDGTIYPGANDDASGVGVLLEIARLWHERGYRPRRTVLFAAWNAEEQGLLGSAYYVAHPAYPLSQTQAMLQLDMVGQGRGYYISVSADEQQDALILAHLENAAGQVEGRLNFGKYEAASDHDSFHKQGVPAVWLSWERPEYRHLPEDSADTIDANKLQATGRVVALALMTMADEQ